MEMQRKETTEMLNDLTSRDQRMMFGLVTMVHLADSREQLDSDTETILTVARKHLCQMSVLRWQQKDGLDTEISEGGSNFSGGQKQRLSIARALVGKPDIYIFDDSFSALDFATDARLRQALKPVTRQAITLIVAQRVSTIMHADRILVLDNGRLAGCGTHRQLLKSCPIYREIAASQLSEEELTYEA